MRFSLLFISTMLYMHNAYASVEKSMFDIKDNGEHCEATIENGQTKVNIYAHKKKTNSYPVTIKQHAILHQSYVDGVCMLTGSDPKAGSIMYLLYLKTGKLVQINNPIAFSENHSGDQIAVEYYDNNKRAVYIADSKGKENNISFSNYSLSALGYNFHTMKFTPDGEHLMIVEGMNFAEKMVLISTSKKRDIQIKDVPSSIANTEGALTFIDDKTAVVIEDRNTYLISNLNQKNKIHSPKDHVFVGSFDEYLVFLNSKSLMLYNFELNSFGEEISIPPKLTEYLLKNAVEYVEVKQGKGNRFTLKTQDGEFYLFSVRDKKFKKINKHSPCSPTGDYCL